jgi:uncharacterized protein with FMN-binding domain
MKKYIVSIFVIATFAVYVLYQRVSGVGNVVIVNNPSIIPIREGGVDDDDDDFIPPKTARTPAPTTAPKSTATKTTNGLYKDGNYTGISADAYYGNIQVLATISGGNITDVQFLDYPQDRSNSIRINTYAMPILKQEAIQVQNANVDTVSGASYSSEAFRQSLSSALAQAKK